MYKLIVLLLLLFAAPAHAAGVVVSIKPLHSLVASIMEGDGHAPPVLLVNTKASPHSFTLKPSQMQALKEADLVFYLGDGYELFLQHALENLPASAHRVALQHASGITLLSFRHG